MNDIEKEIWDFLHRHLQSIFNRDVAAYRATTSPDLSLYEWFVSPHRQDGLDFHFFMIGHAWAGTGGDFRYDLLEPRLQVYGATSESPTAVVSYTFMLTIADAAGAITSWPLISASFSLPNPVSIAFDREATV